MAAARSRLLFDGAQAWAEAWARSLQWTIAAAVSAILAAVTGYAALLLWIQPEHRPALLAITSIALGFLAWLLHRRAYAIRRPPQSVHRALNEIRNDLHTVRAAVAARPASQSPKASTED